ncbi:MAG: ABC transporter ATP-binding protein [Elusimicrobia bacterium]|nr:ABC transporter ATP-binding protein [Elusimicrobiota bacterium]
MKILDIKNLSVEYSTDKKAVPAVRDVSFSLDKNDSIAVVGESGCGKSTLGLSVLNLLPKEAKISHGQIFFHDKDILKLDKNELQKIRGSKIGTVFQDPLSSLNPVIKISEQIRETLEIHGQEFPEDKITQLLEMVQLTDSERVKNSYPHQLSGGMRQRIMIAIALAANPEILIADEPTTALDVTIQKEILELLKKLLKELNLTIIFITHNFGIISDICNKIAVLYAGEIVEQGNTTEILKNPEHPYTRALLAAIPEAHKKLTRFNTIPGTVPDLALHGGPSGCKFHPRCSRKIEKCINTYPELEETGSKKLRCFNP